MTPDSNEQPNNRKQILPQAIDLYESGLAGMSMPEDQEEQPSMGASASGESGMEIGEPTEDDSPQEAV